jgi:histidine phosphotransferase ChpT
MADENDLAALIGSRLCHDLISPLGAIANGVELLTLDGKGHGPEVALIAESVASANARIRFFRIAYGSFSTGQNLARSELAQTVSDWCAHGRLKVVWRAPGDHPRSEAKLVFLALQCLETATPRGGEISVEHDGAGWECVVAAPVIKRDPDSWQMLVDPAHRPRLSAAQVQFGLLQQALQHQRRRVTVQQDDGAMVLRMA